MSDDNRGNRPLSPHLTIYRLQISMVTSIVNRIAGAGMMLAAVLIVWWLLAASTSPTYFEFVDGILTSWLGLLILFGSLWALWFHFLAGIRHLFMDFGKGYGLKAVNFWSWALVVGSLVLTAASIYCLAMN
ncbi:MAG: succinate dehydrogenase, cytochrome b556 subunit [Rhodobacteraceae bacterium]|nr:MAG: succinate dehydrogenase, cytochrome b556 subunit [Paracoccaceae bacterium]